MEMYITLLVHFVKKCAINRNTVPYVVNCVFFPLNLTSYYQQHILIYFSFCSLNFILPTNT